MSGDRAVDQRPSQREAGGLPPGRDEALGQARERGGDALLTLLRDWRDEVRIRSNAQQLAAAEDARWSLLLGVGATVLAAVGASSVLSASSNPAVTSLAGWITLAAAVLAGTQTVVRFGERSGDHRGAAASFGRVKIRLDLLLARMARGTEPTQEELEEHAVVMERLDTETPVVSERFWKKAKERIAAGLVT